VISYIQNLEAIRNFRAASLGFLSQSGFQVNNDLVNARKEIFRCLNTMNGILEKERRTAFEAEIWDTSAIEDLECMYITLINFIIFFFLQNFIFQINFYYYFTNFRIYY